MDNTYEHEFDPVTPPEQEGFTAQPESSADPDPVYEAHTASQQRYRGSAVMTAPRPPP